MHVETGCMIYSILYVIYSDTILPSMKSAPQSSNEFLRDSNSSCVVFNVWITAFFIPGTTTVRHRASWSWMERKLLNWSSDHMLSAGIPRWRCWEGFRCFWMELLQRWTELKGWGEQMPRLERQMRGNTVIRNGQYNKTQ